MDRPAVRTSDRPHDLDFIGDHLAIDFINTVRVVDGEVADTLRSDKDVEVWLGLASVPVSPRHARWEEGSLLAATRRLRKATLKAIEAKRAGRRPSLGVINAFLAAATSPAQLVAVSDTELDLRRSPRGETPEQYLAPVAEAVADLLAHGEIDFIRQCAGERCILWFYDRTKGHGRRYCTSAGCGNRAKVAAYRARARARED